MIQLTVVKFQNNTENYLEFKNILKYFQILLLIFIQKSQIFIQCVDYFQSDSYKLYIF